MIAGRDEDCRGGQMAQIVTDNPKCRKCMHFDQQRQHFPVCAVGLRPTTCGGGEDPARGHWPIATLGIGAAEGDGAAPVPQAPYRRTVMVSPHVGVGDLQDMQGRQPQIPGGQQIEVLGEEYAAVVKSVVAELRKPCAACSVRIHGVRGPNLIKSLPCTCRSVAQADMVKALRRRLPNFVRIINDAVLTNTIRHYGG